MDCQEYQQILSAHVDGALSLEERLHVQSHLEGCPRCKQTFLWETKARNALRTRLAPIPATRRLREKVRQQLEEPRVFSWPYLSHGLAAAFALLLIVAVPYLTWRTEAKHELFTDVIAQYRTLTQGKLEAQQPAPPLPPPAQILDLSPWGYTLLAKQTQRIANREGRIFIYQGRPEEYLLAQEFDGADLPSPSDARVLPESTRRFVVYSEVDVNLIAWKEKNVLCLIAGKLPQEKLLDLAKQIVARS